MTLRELIEWLFGLFSAGVSEIEVVGQTISETSALDWPIWYFLIGFLVLAAIFSAAFSALKKTRATEGPKGLTGGLKKRRRVQIIVLAFVALGVSTAIIGYAMQDGINFFRSPSQVAEAPPPPSERFRIGGLVEEGSLVRGQGAEVSFRVTDGGASIPVVYTGILPDLFEEGQGMVGQGNYIDGTFEAVEILAKHDETYMPAEVIDALKDQGVYVEPETAANGGAVTN